MLLGPPCVVHKSTCVRFAGKIIKHGKITYIMPTSGGKVSHLLRFKEQQIPYPTPELTHRDIIKGAEAAYFSKELSDILGGLRADDEYVQWLQTWFDSEPDDEAWEYTTVARRDEADILYKHYLCFMSATTKNYMHKKFPEGCAGEGFGSRVLWVICTQKDVVEGEPNPDPAEARQVAKRLVWIKDNVKGMVTYTPGAKKFRRTYEKLTADRMLAMDGTSIGGFLARQPMYMLKIAMIRAASEATKPGPLTIDTPHFEWAHTHLAALEPEIKKLAHELNADVATRCAMAIRETLKFSELEVVLAHQPVGTKYTRIKAMVEAEVRERFVPEYGPKEYGAALRILEELEWAYRPGVPYRVNGYRRARKIVCLTQEED